MVIERNERSWMVNWLRLGISWSPVLSRIKFRQFESSSDFLVENNSKLGVLCAS